MAKRQTRVSVSVRGLTAQRAKVLADELHEAGIIDKGRGPGFSPLIEHLIAQACKLHGIPEETVLEPRQRANTGPKGPVRHGGLHQW